MKSTLNLGIIFCVLSFVFGCSSFGYESPRYVKLAHEITEKTAKKLKAQKNLYLAGTGGQMMNDIQMMMMGFDLYEVIDIETARQLLVDSVQEYLSAINSNEEIRPYLHNYPFTAKNVEIVIYIYNPDGSQVPLDKITIAAANQGRVVYYVDDPQKHTIKTIHEETYEEALHELALNQEHKKEASQIKDKSCNAKPIISEAVAKNGAKVNIEIDSLEYSMFQLRGEGFKPYEPMNFISNSYDEFIHTPICADENGHILPMKLLPTVIGKSGGVCHIHILRDEGAIRIELPWGTEIAKGGLLVSK